MDAQLWVVIAIDEYFNIPFNEWNETKTTINNSNRKIISNIPDFIEPNVIFDSTDPIYQFGISPSDPNPFYEPPNFIRRPQLAKPLPDIRLVGIYSSKESADKMVLGHPKRKILGPTFSSN